MRTQTDQDELLDRGGNPTLRELLSHLVFSPANGNIRLNNGRLVLQRVSQTTHLREELIQQYGKRQAYVLMTRLGFQAGREDAEFVRASWPNLDLGDAFTAGTRLHTLSGCVRVETIHNDFDFRKGRFSGEFVWHDSAESVEYCERHLRSHEPVCWSQVGYASGYATAFFGKLIVYKEVECLAMGHKHCRVVGKPAEAWGENDDAVQVFRREVTPKRRVPLERASEGDAEAPAPAARASGDDESVAAALLEPVKSHLDLVAKADVPLLLTGPSGSGRGAAARYVHDAAFGSQAHAEEADCAGLDAESLNALLARRARKGGRGRRPAQVLRTLVLSNIEALDSRAQAALLAFLAADEAAARGAIDFRLVATSSLALHELATHPRLRRDLFHHLAVLPLAMPALKDRRDDIPRLARLILRRAAERHGRPAPALTDEAEHELKSLDLPGNMPELQALLVGAMLTAAPKAAIDAADLRAAPPPDQRRSHNDDPLAFDQDLERAIRGGAFSLEGLNVKIYQTTMRLADGNMSSAARMLGLSRAQLAYRLTRS